MDLSRKMSITTYRKMYEMQFGRAEEKHAEVY
jgi:hypothetical protein